MQKLPLFFLFCILHLTLRVFFEALFLSVHFKLSSSITQNRVFEYSFSISGCTTSAVFYHGGWAAYCAVDRRAEFFLPGEDCLRTDIAVHAGRCPFLHFFYKGRSAFWRTVPLGGCDAITEFPVDGQLIADFPSCGVPKSSCRRRVRFSPQIPSSATVFPDDFAVSADFSFAGPA